MSGPEGLAFVDVDTQFDFMEPKGPLYVPGAEKLRPRLAELVELARRRGITVLATADAHVPDDPEFEEFGAHCVDGSPGAERIDTTRVESAPVFTPEEAADEAELAAGRVLVFKKRNLDPMSNPNLKRAIKARRLGRFVVFGVATDYCVRIIAVELADRNHNVIVVSDAVAAISREGEREAAEEFKRRGIRTATTEEVIEAGGWIE